MALRADVAWGRALLALARDDARPELHYFLFDRYFRLAEHHRRRGREARADRLRRVAEWHLERGGHEPPPAVAAAAALPVPRRPALTWAVAGRPEPPEPPNAA